MQQSRWALICVLCRERVGACIQCSIKTCKTAYHVTCAFKHGLEMKAIIEDEMADDGVKLRVTLLLCNNIERKKQKYREFIYNKIIILILIILILSWNFSSQPAMIYFIFSSRIVKNTAKKQKTKSAPAAAVEVAVVEKVGRILRTVNPEDVNEKT